MELPLDFRFPTMHHYTVSVARLLHCLFCIQWWEVNLSNVKLCKVIHETSVMIV